VTVGLLPGALLDRLSERLGPLGAQVRLEDADVCARNPARILPLVQDLLDGSPSPVRMVVDLQWAVRSGPERAELCHHEVLLNLAFAGSGLRMLCAYDADAVGREVLSCAERTHARITSGGQIRESAHYRASSGRPADCQKPLSPPPVAVEELPVGPDLSRLRQDVGSSPATAPLSGSRREDFVLAIDEVATNALEYGGPPRTLRLWREAGHVVGEVTSRGRVEDPLAGRRRPDPRASRGRGLWIANQLCDLVQLRNVGGANSLRLHVRCD
jgi:anti-sigma regulatory factor (Ser/Thr protein kinase)